jgi:hypothetical protein
MRALKNTLMAVTTGLVMVLVLSASARAQAIPQGGTPTSPRAGVVPRDKPPPGAKAWDSETKAALEAWECDLGNVCFWNGPHGTGSRCMWDVSDPDWLDGAIRCSWAGTDNVRSAFNNSGPEPGHPWTGVVYYREPNFHNRVGCERNFHQSDLAGTYKVRSHEWTTGRCG